MVMGTGWSRRASRRLVFGAGKGMAAAGALLALVSACGPLAPSKEQVGTRPVTLTWGIRTSVTPEAVQAVLQEYRQLRPNVTVEQFDARGNIAASLEKLAAGLAAGVPLDVVNGHLAARQLIEAIDVVQPIDDLAKKERFNLAKYNQEWLDAFGRYGGKLYTLPYAYGGNAAAVAHNKGLFRQAGVREPSADWSKPWLWDEFRDAMRRLTRSEAGALTQVGAAGFGGWTTTPLMPWGARWLAPDFRTIVCDSPQTIDAYTKYTDLLFKDRVFAQSPGASLGPGNPFLTGKAGIWMRCCTALALAKETRGTGIEWAFITMPKGTVASLDLAPTVMGMAKPSKQRAEAWDFLKFLDERSRLAGMEDRMPAVLPDVLPWLKQHFAEWPDSRAEMLAEGVRVAKPMELIILHPQWQKMSQQVLDPGWQEVLAQTKGVTAFLRAAKPVLQNIVDEHARSRRK